MKRGLAVAPDPDREEVHGRAPDEAGDEHIDRVMVEGVGRVHLLDITIFHDDDPVTHGHGLDLVVGYIYKGCLEPLVELEDVNPGLDPEFGVQVGERLVHQEGLGLADDRPAEGDTLALAA